MMAEVISILIVIFACFGIIIVSIGDISKESKEEKPPPNLKYHQIQDLLLSWLQQKKINKQQFLWSSSFIADAHLLHQLKIKLENLSFNKEGSEFMISIVCPDTSKEIKGFFKKEYLNLEYFGYGKLKHYYIAYDFILGDYFYNLLNKLLKA